MFLKSHLLVECDTISDVEVIKSKMINILRYITIAYISYD